MNIEQVATSSASLDAHAVGAPVRKRVFDLALSVPLCLLAVPVIVAAGLVLAVQLRSWPFFVQKRVGRHGRVFSMPKLRTLPVVSDAYADKLDSHLEPFSRFSRFLRRTHLDELPQLFLVPGGVLSLVGPRPLMAAEAERVGTRSPYYTMRVAVPQGCTGLWQIGDHQHGRVSDAPEYDLWYLGRASCRLDAWILWRTVAQLFGRPGVSLSSVPAWLCADGPRRA